MFELFESQPAAYKKGASPEVEKRVAVEQALPELVSIYWHKGRVIGIDRFGASAPAKVLFEKFGFSIDNIVNQSKKLLKK